MAVLSSIDIRREIKAGRIGIKPALSPARLKGALGPNSLDLRLSSDFYFYKPEAVEASVKIPLDLSKAKYLEVTEQVSSKALILKPGELVLGMTVESVSLPKDIMAQIGGRSSLGRMGITVHITAPFHHAGSRNRIMLEIKNEGPLEVELKEGIYICQIVFEKLESPTDIPYSKVGKVVKGQ